MKKLFTLLFIASIAFMQAAQAAVVNAGAQKTVMLNEATTISTSNHFYWQPAVGLRTHQAILAGTGTLSATIVVQGSNDGTNWVDLMTFNLTNLAPTDAAVSQAPYPFERAKVTAISGTGAKATLIVGN